MRRPISMLALASLLAACSARQQAPQSALAETGQTRVGHQRAAGIAYEHAVELEVPGARMRQTATAVQQACAALPAHGCTLLESSIRGGLTASASVRMRITPDGVNQVLHALDGRGKLVSQSSKGEDLVEPIQDGERKMAMLNAYREQLQTLAGQRALAPEAMIKLHRELAEVQSEIEKAATSQAQLRRRVDTELLTVAMHERASAGQAGKVKQALEDFGDDLLHGVAMLITFVASTIPFAVAGAIGYAAWRRLRARRRHRKQPATPAPDQP